jgi:energy-coupling factor transporter ATP-binding protein EcfA2
MNYPKRHPATLGHSRRRSELVGVSFSARDRLSHLYLIGQTGTGKSTLLKNLALQDAQNGVGYCLIDPHGDLANELVNTLDVPLRHWKVSDTISPYGYNPLTKTSPAHRPLITSGLIDALKKQWIDAWGVRMEHLLRYAILALLEQPRADLRDIMRLFVDKAFQKEVLARISDPQVQQFWTIEYPAMNYKTAIDGVAPIANKLGAFLAHPVVRKALCEPDEPLRFRSIMDKGEILIVNLAKGKLGNDMANVMGGLIVSSIMNAAFTRHDTPEADRRPFMLYVDEFHSFTTTSFASMLSEVRKYGLGVTLAHQYIDQADEAVFPAIMGNVGSMLAFRVGALDAPLIATQLHGVLPSDLISLSNHHAYARLMNHGEPTKPFSLTTWP